MDVFISAQRVETKSGVGFEWFFGGIPKKSVTTELLWNILPTVALSIIDVLCWNEVKLFHFNWFFYLNGLELTMVEYSFGILRYL